VRENFGRRKMDIRQTGEVGAGFPATSGHREIERGDDAVCSISPSGRRRQRRVRAHVPSAVAATSRSRSLLARSIASVAKSRRCTEAGYLLPAVFCRRFSFWTAGAFQEGLFRDKGTILELALGLVVFTVVGVGFFTTGMIPEMPVAIAFALAAIVSPTDPIARIAIAARVPIPKRLMHILEGESLP